MKTIIGTIFPNTEKEQTLQFKVRNNATDEEIEDDFRERLLDITCAYWEEKEE